MFKCISSHLMFLQYDKNTYRTLLQHVAVKLDVGAGAHLAFSRY